MVRDNVVPHPQPLVTTQHLREHGLEQGPRIHLVQGGRDHRCCMVQYIHTHSGMKCPYSMYKAHTQLHIRTYMHMKEAGSNYST